MTTSGSGRSIWSSRNSRTSTRSNDLLAKFKLIVIDVFRHLRKNEELPLLSTFFALFSTSRSSLLRPLLSRPTLPTYKNIVIVNSVMCTCNWSEIYRMNQWNSSSSLLSKSDKTSEIRWLYSIFSFQVVWLSSSLLVHKIRTISKTWSRIGVRSMTTRSPDSGNSRNVVPFGRSSTLSMNLVRFSLLRLVLKKNQRGLWQILLVNSMNKPKLIKYAFLYSQSDEYEKKAMD